MTTFHEAIVEENRDLADKAKVHVLNDLIARGDISEEQMQRWIVQGYLLVEDYGRFLAALAARAPRTLRACVLDYLLNVHMELGLFSKPVGGSGLLPDRPRMDFATHAYVSFLYSAAHVLSFGEGVAACYALNISWVEARRRLVEAPANTNPLFEELAEGWHQDDPSLRLEGIEKCIDHITEDASADLKRAMHESFRYSIHYLLRFWDGIVEGSSW